MPPFVKDVDMIIRAIFVRAWHIRNVRTAMSACASGLVLRLGGAVRGVCRLALAILLVGAVQAGAPRAAYAADVDPVVVYTTIAGYPAQIEIVRRAPSGVNFVYTNNNPQGPSTVSAFQRDDNGVLTPLPGSPFSTGGSGSGDGLFAANRITTVGNFLYAANDGSNDVAAFTIHPGSGALMPIAGSPFPTGAAAGLGISLAGTPDGQFLYASSAGVVPDNIRVFRILPGGALQAVGPLIPAGGLPDGIKVSPNGKWLAVALPFVGPHGAVAMFSIDSITGALTPVPGSPFPPRGPGGPDGLATGVDINCASDTVFVGEANGTATIVDVLGIDPTSGALTPIPDSPFTPSGGVNSNVPLLYTTDKILFVSNQRSNTITSLTVAADGTLTPLAGSPFPEGGGIRSPSGMATDQAGLFLYVANFPDQVIVFSTDSSGFLTVVPGSPFSTGAPGGLESIAAFPAKACPGP